MRATIEVNVGSKVMVGREWSGGCLCGQVRYRIEGKPLSTVICYCENCRRHSGSALSINLSLREDQYHQIGETAVYKDHGETGAPLYRGFCPNCGSSLTSRSDWVPGFVIVKAGTLDDQKDIRPTVEVFTCDAPDWIRPTETLIRCERNPSAEDIAAMNAG